MSKTYIGLVKGKKYYDCTICNRYHYVDSEIGKSHFKGQGVRIRGQERRKL